MTREQINAIAFHPRHKDGRIIVSRKGTEESAAVQLRRLYQSRGWAPHIVEDEIRKRLKEG
jgi:hypothetical protein